MKTIEQQLKVCHNCKKHTTHLRNKTSTGLFMLLIHVILTVMTVGVWLVLAVVWKIMNRKIGGWRCEECGK